MINSVTGSLKKYVDFQGRAISHGNSGGPLVDNEGNVIGTNSWRSTKEQYNGAVSLDAMCIKIMKCKGKHFWSRD